MRLRQIALLGRDLTRQAADIETVLGLGAAWEDPAVGRYGLHNRVWPVGDTFLEIVSPIQPGTTAGRLLDKRGRDGGYMVIFQVDDLAVAEARVQAAGVRIVDRYDGDGAAFRHLHPRDLPGAIASIDAMHPSERWAWGGPDWPRNVRTDRVRAITGAQLLVAGCDEVSAKWAEALGLPRQRTGAGWRLLLAGGELRFAEVAPGEMDGLTGIDLVATDAAAIQETAAKRGCIDAAGGVLLCGTRIRLLPPGG